MNTKALLSVLLITLAVASLWTLPASAQVPAPPLLPVPCDQCNGTTCQKDWDGTIPELYFADAMWQCSAKLAGGYQQFEATDLYATAIIGYENESAMAFNYNFTAWPSIRQDPARNCDQQALTPNATVPWRSLVVPESIAYSTPDHLFYANNDLRAAGVNLCIAQMLRGLVSGASTGEALVFSDADQRELLEIVRERSQIAMLTYGLLGEAFSMPQFKGVLLNSAEVHMADVSNWAWSAGAPALTAMGNDFAAAVQLHTYATQEMASLLARSRSADLPRMSTPQTQPVDTWGYNSWFQREMALMFGGDPLAIASTSTNPAAWTSPIGTPFPGTVLGLDWPQFPQQPYNQVALDSPLTMQLLSLANNFGDVALSTSSTGYTCQNAFTTNNFDPNATANWIYANVEFDLEVANCYTTTASCPPPTPRTLRTVPANGQVDDTWLLYSLYNIAPAHASTLAQYLIGSIADPTCPANPTAYSGASALAGVDKNGGSLLSFQPGLLRFSPQAILTPRTLTQLAPTYTTNSILRFADPLEMYTYGPQTDAGAYGFDGGCVISLGGVCVEESTDRQGKQESMRTMGAAAAQSATMQMLLDTEVFLKNPVPNIGYAGWQQGGGNAQPNASILNTYLSNADKIIGVLKGASGTAVSVRVVPSPALSASNVLTLVPKSINVNGAVETEYYVRVAVTTEDSFWSQTVDNYSVYFVPTVYASDLAAHPEAKIFGVGVADVVQSASQYGTFLRHDLTTGITPADGIRYLEFGVYVPASGRGSLIVASGNVGSGVSSASAAYRLLAGEVAIPTATLIPAQEPASFFGGYMSFGGSFGALMERQSLPYQPNPVEPAYDGFDLPNHWVPPFNAGLLGGDPSQPSASTYLSLAQTAATNATTAVATAFMDLQQQASDAATAQAAAVQAAATVQQASDALCGQGNTSCDLTITSTALNPSWYPSAPSMPDCSGQSGTGLQACQVTQTIVSFEQNVLNTLVNPTPMLIHTNTTYPIADAVLQQLPTNGLIPASGAPAFAAYAGGSLQQAFINQWAALEAPVDKITTLQATVAAASDQVTAAAADLDFSQTDANVACSPQAMAQAVEAGFSASATASIVPPGASVSVSFSPGPLIAQQQKCQELSLALPKAQAEASAAFAEALLSVANATVDFAGAESNIQVTGAQVAELIQQAKLASSQAALESKLTASTLQTSTGLWRVYRSDDVWRAKALLDNARTYALAARRAIESQYVVDLSTMEQSEAFVASPATWANDVYTYDLSMPSAVGLAVGGSSTGGVYTNQVADYVGNLQSFVAGYSVTRPTALDQSEIDVVTLPGFGLPTPVDAGVATYYPPAGQWELHCPPDPPGNPNGEWIGPPLAAGDIDQACSVAGLPVKPDMVRLNFALDAWGRVNGDVANPPVVDRYNVRWGLMALNFVGTGIKDCTLAADPADCYQSEYINYNLTQVGPSLLTDFQQTWRSLNTPTTTIEGAKGLAAEIWLDPLQDGWSTPYISAISRTELELAPIGGAYELDFAVPPEVVLDNVERIQLMVGSSAWVAEQGATGP